MQLDYTYQINSVYYRSYAFNITNHNITLFYSVRIVKVELFVRLSPLSNRLSRIVTIHTLLLIGLYYRYKIGREVVLYECDFRQHLSFTWRDLLILVKFCKNTYNNLRER